MKKKKDSQLYKVNLYHLLGPSYTDFDIGKYTCDVESLDTIIVSVQNKNKNPFRDSVGECKEAIEGFSIPLVKCYKTSRYDAWYDEHITEFNLPYGYNYWDKYSLYLVSFDDIKESNLATPEDLKAYDPEKTIWYNLLKEIQEKGIDFDYHKEAIREIYGKDYTKKRESV